MNTLLLRGCRYQPLSSYLKGVGVFRLVAAQADPAATARWTEVGLELRSGLDRDALIDFFLRTYSPTPVLAPWNGGSGFYSKGNKFGIEAIKNSSDERFVVYRHALRQAEKVVAGIGAEKSSAKSDEDDRRREILVQCRNTLPDDCIDWLDAAIALSSEGKRAFAPVLGTGGNEGRLDYTNNFMENVANLLIATSGKKATNLPVQELLANALFDSPTVGLQDIAVGQYDPGRTGGFNQGQGIESSSVANPWTAVLTIEGAIVWAGGIYRKQGVSYRSFLCSPFTVWPTPAGYGSSAQKDKTSGRAEIWAPLWKRFADYGEIRALFREGRAALGGKPAGNGLEFAESIASLGVDRGISSFVRYMFLKRRGDSYIAPPVGLFEVKRNTNADLIREIAPALDRAESAMKAKGKEASNDWLSIRHAAEEAIFAALTADTEERSTDLAAAFGRCVRWLLQSGIPVETRLHSAWAERCGSSSAEAGIAVSLATLPEILRNLSPNDNLHSWMGRGLAERMSNTLRRRVLSEQPIQGVPVALEHLRRFLDGDVADERIEDLAYAFSCTDLPAKGIVGRPGSSMDLWPIYCLLKLMFLSIPIKLLGSEVRLQPDLSIPALLSAGRVSEAAAVAVRRLRIAGLSPLKVEYGETGDARRLSAALLIPFDGYSTLLRAVTDMEVETEKQGDMK